MATVFSISRAASPHQPQTDKPPVRVTVPELGSKTVGDLKNLVLAQINKKCNINRIRFAWESTHEILGPNEKALSAFGFKDQVSIVFKDLGPQISWKRVFIVEYFFPMIVFPLLWVLIRKLPKSQVTQFLFPGAKAAVGYTAQWQDLLAVMFTLHFVKRELETLYVHRFGNDTMPLANIFKNSGYYWLFAFWIAHSSLHPLYTVPANSSRRLFGVGLFVIAELLNLKSHIDFRNLRPHGTRVRRVPTGFWFNLISCPNYLFEILAWVGFTLASQSVAAAVFTLVGAAQMTQWAIQKHQRYKREFDGQDGRALYPKNRKVIIPLLF